MLVSLMLTDTTFDIMYFDYIMYQFFCIIHTKSLAWTPVSDCSLTRDTTTGRNAARCT